MSQVSLSQGDFTSLMKVLNENLSEGQAPPPTQEEVKPLAGKSTEQVETAITPSKTGSLYHIYSLIIQDFSPFITVSEIYICFVRLIKIFRIVLKEKNPFYHHYFL